MARSPLPSDVAEQTLRGAAGSLEAVADLLARGGVVALTGAGVSTDSGIPDYRGRDGVRRVMPMQYGEFVATSAARQRYWARSFVGWERFREAAPNDGHRAVARLQRAGAIALVVTQNVDGLHQRAGAVGVVELHGSLADIVCLTCGERSPRWRMQERMAAANPGFAAAATSNAADGSRVSSQIRPDGDVVLPDAWVTGFVLPCCLGCGADTLKPDVVFFGESVPKPQVERCQEAVERASALLVLGSSLAVMSGYRFVRQAASRGIPVAILTQGQTRGDPQATVKLEAALTPTLSALAEAIT